MAAFAGRANAGPHGFFETLYVYSSAGATDSCAFANLDTARPFYNSILALATFAGRFLVIGPALVIAAKPEVLRQAGTLPADGAQSAPVAGRNHRHSERADLPVALSLGSSGSICHAAPPRRLRRCAARRCIVGGQFLAECSGSLVLAAVAVRVVVYVQTVGVAIARDMRDDAIGDGVVDRFIEIIAMQAGYRVPQRA